ncbi:MAG: VWA domain-containing protein [Candidatus Sericytochromatia bacterium]|nr:VWA domain-containing protein [Candidatus Sericytochromatia bacterium]
MRQRVLPILLCLSLAGCVAGTPTAGTNSAPRPSGAPSAVPQGTPAAVPTGTPTAGAAAGASADIRPETPSTTGTPTALPSTPSTSYGGGSQYQAPALRAGDVDDNVGFPAYLTYLANFRDFGVRKVDVSERITIRVMDTSQKGVPDAQVAVTAGGGLPFEGRTASDGRVLCFPKTFTSAADRTVFTVTATKNGQTVTTEQQRTNPTWELAVPMAVNRAAAANLDLVFLLDATGSMGDEIGRIQATIRTVSDRIKQLNGNKRLRLGLVAYRDRGDAEPLVVQDFTEDLSAFQSRLAAVQASGGGDTPEDLENGLNAALSRMSWSVADATRLVFLVADATPHIDYPQSFPYPESIAKAVKTGVKLYPIGASGLETTGEYVFRQLAQQTLAKYLFLTYGGQPGPGGGVSATVGSFQENNLDELIVTIVKNELAPLSQ